MEEMNPYATPRSTLRSDSAAPAGRPRGYGWYKGFSLAYGLLFVVFGLIAFARQALVVSPIGLVVTAVILAPLISYVLVARRAVRLFYAWSSLHLLGAICLVAFVMERVNADDGFRLGFSLFMVASSLLSWLSSLYFHWRLGKK